MPRRAAVPALSSKTARTGPAEWMAVSDSGTKCSAMLTMRPPESMNSMSSGTYVSFIHMTTGPVPWKSNSMPASAARRRRPCNPCTRWASLSASSTVKSDLPRTVTTTRLEVSNRTGAAAPAPKAAACGPATRPAAAKSSTARRRRRRVTFMGLPYRKCPCAGKPKRFFTAPLTKPSSEAKKEPAKAKMRGVGGAAREDAIGGAGFCCKR